MPDHIRAITGDQAIAGRTVLFQGGECSSPLSFVTVEEDPRG